jgi:CheY-like chemotaxis protein
MRHMDHDEGIKKTRILIVEDVLVFAKQVKLRLESRDYMVIDIVDTGEKAIEAAKRDQPDVILMDITLNTSMTGIDAAREITKVSNIPIVFLTGNTDSSILDSGREISTNEVVAKTFDDEELHVAIQQSIISNAMNSEFKKNADK